MLRKGQQPEEVGVLPSLEDQANLIQQNPRVARMSFPGKNKMVSSRYDKMFQIQYPNFSIACKNMALYAALMKLESIHTITASPTVS